MEEKTERFVMRVSPEFLRLVDDWRRQQPEIPSRSDAVRTMAIVGFTKGFEDPVVVDLLDIIITMAKNKELPDKYAERVVQSLEGLGRAQHLREELIKSLEQLKNLPSADLLPSRKPRKGG